MTAYLERKEETERGKKICIRIRMTMGCKERQNNVLQFIGHFPKVDS